MGALTSRVGSIQVFNGDHYSSRVFKYGSGDILKLISNAPSTIVPCMYCHPANNTSFLRSKYLYTHPSTIYRLYRLSITSITTKSNYTRTRERYNWKVVTFNNTTTHVGPELQTATS